MSKQSQLLDVQTLGMMKTHIFKILCVCSLFIYRSVRFSCERVTVCRYFFFFALKCNETRSLHLILSAFYIVVKDSDCEIGPICDRSDKRSMSSSRWVEIRDFEMTGFHLSLEPMHLVYVHLADTHAQRWSVNIWKNLHATPFRFIHQLAFFAGKIIRCALKFRLLDPISW